ncbi:MAG TPA: site-2 protease family protein, partial [Polyangiaceae bacterium]|nr:site-2 protease family protein [Polyangiaceae bacterium]
PALLLCPSCKALVHRQQLETLAKAAELASQRGELADAMANWRKALDLLPPESKQATRITSTIRELREKLESGAARPSAAGATPAAATHTGWKRWGAAGGSLLAFALFKLKSLWLLVLAGWKPLLLGLTKLGTVWTMLLSVGVYWTLFGWQFAVGLVLCIYVHEIGHVVALKRLGIAASSPMFIPGLGAVVRLNQYPIDVDEEAQVGLAGPRWGLGISLVVFALSRLLHSPMLSAIAHVSAWINLFNLLPIPPLDGGRGFRALTNPQRWICAAGLGVVYALTLQPFVGIIALLALARGFEKRTNHPGNPRILAEFLLLGTLLAVVSHAAG